VYCKSCVPIKRGTRQVCKTCAHVIDHPALYGMQRPPSAFGSERSYSSRSLLPPSTSPNTSPNGGRPSKSPGSPGFLPTRGSSRSISQSSNASSIDDDVLPPPSSDLVIDDDSDGESGSQQNGGSHHDIHAEYVPKTPTKVSAQTLFGDDPAFLQSLVAAVGELPTGAQLSLLSPTSAARMAQLTASDGNGTTTTTTSNGDESSAPSSPTNGTTRLTAEQSVAAAMDSARAAYNNGTDLSPPSPLAVSATAPRHASSRASGPSSASRTGTLSRGDTLAALFKDDPSFLASLAVAVGDSSITKTT
jgi:hypothetical protein